MLDEPPFSILTGGWEKRLAAGKFRHIIQEMNSFSVVSPPDFSNLTLHVGGNKIEAKFPFPRNSQIPRIFGQPT